MKKENKVIILILIVSIIFTGFVSASILGNVGNLFNKILGGNVLRVLKANEN